MTTRQMTSYTNIRLGQVRILERGERTAAPIASILYTTQISERLDRVDGSLPQTIASAVAERLDPVGLWSFISRQHGGADLRDIGPKWTLEVNVLVCASSRQPEKSDPPDASKTRSHSQITGSTAPFSHLRERLAPSQRDARSTREGSANRDTRCELRRASGRAGARRGSLAQALGSQLQQENEVMP